MSASCSIEPDSRRSESMGRLSERPSVARESCERTMMGTFNSRASTFSERVISATARVRFSARPGAWMS